MFCQIRGIFPLACLFSKTKIMATCLVQYFTVLVEMLQTHYWQAFKIFALKWSWTMQLCPQFVGCWVLLYFVTCQFWPYSQELLYWLWRNNTIASVPMEQPKKIVKVDTMTDTKQSKHSADSPNKLSDLHTTQTQVSEVRWSARFNGHLVVASMFA